MNKAIIMGRLVRDPEIRYSQGAEPMAIALYTLAVDRKYKKDGEQSADFISCKAFKGNAKFAEMYLHQGMKIAIVGHIQTGSYINKNGQKVYTTDVVVDEQEFAESKAATQDEATRRQQESGNTSGDGWMNIPDGIDEELPFN